MPYSYMIPSISSLPAGYECVIAAPLGRIADNLIGGSGTVTQSIKVFAEGQQLHREDLVLEFEDGALRTELPEPFVWKWQDELPEGASGYLETSFALADNQPKFRTNAVLTFYSIYNADGKKSFFSDNSYLYASPPIIAQIAEYGQYVDAYPVVRVDRERDFGESIIFINPYQKPLKARILGFDGRQIPTIRVPAHAARRVALDGLLRDDESSWNGQIQITATNRVITYDVKHALRDPNMISDHEHLDPYRGEPTHFPATRWLRLMYGKWRTIKGYEV